MAQDITHNTSGEGGGWISEDWLALILGLVIFGISLFSFKGVDLLGWGAEGRRLDRAGQGDHRDLQQVPDRRRRDHQDRRPEDHGQEKGRQDGDRHGRGGCLPVPGRSAVREEGHVVDHVPGPHLPLRPGDHDHGCGRPRRQRAAVHDRLHPGLLAQLPLLVHGPFRLHRRHQGADGEIRHPLGDEHGAASSASSSP